MKQLSVVVVLMVGGVLVWLLGSRLSSDALGMAVGMTFGMLAGIPTALLVLVSQRRCNRDDDYDSEQHRIPPPYCQPYQPPVIVLAAPREQQPTTVNNYDNRSVTIHTGVQGMPLLADRQREIQQQASGRRFKVVGETEEWQPEHNGWLPPGHSGMRD